MEEPLRHASLFSGIGGFDLAAQWMGWENVFQVEIDKWCRDILEKNFPGVNRYEDIKNFNAKKYEGSIDVISGGFPCQPFSVAGNRRGKEDDRYLWEEMLRFIREVKPSYVVGENVTGIIGMALDTVLLDLENEGYATETYIIPACAKNAWHRRDRVWIIAYSDNRGNRRTSRQDEGEGGKEWLQKRDEMGKSCKSGYLLADADNAGFEKQRQRIADEEAHIAPKCSSWWEAEPGVGRVVDGLSGRVDRIKGLGNAVVPQVVYEIFKAIELHFLNTK